MLVRQTLGWKAGQPIFFHSGARALTEVLPHSKYKTLDGSSHGSVVLGLKPMAASMAQFFAAEAH